MQKKAQTVNLGKREEMGPIQNLFPETLAKELRPTTAVQELTFMLTKPGIRTDIFTDPAVAALHFQLQAATHPKRKAVMARLDRLDKMDSSMDVAETVVMEEPVEAVAEA